MDNPLTTENPITDLSERDMQRVREFTVSGLPGLTKLKETDFYRLAEMYIHGSGYWQIAAATGLSRSLIMYLSHTYGWYSAKREYLMELQEKIKGRVIDSKLVSQDFILLLIQVYQKKLSVKMRKYLATDDSAHVDDINLKEIDKLLKAVEMLQDLNSDGKNSKGKTPAVGLNLGDGVTIERSGDNKVTITPAIDKQLGSMLKKFADSRRAEMEKAANKHDNKQSDEE